MMRIIPALFVAALILGACGRGESPPAEQSAPAAETPSTEADQVYESTGTIESIGENGQSITLNHHEIPGLMGAMTMTFSVDDPSILEGLKPGMEVRFGLRVTASRYIVVEISPLAE